MSLKLKISIFCVLGILALSAMLLGASSLKTSLIEARYETGVFDRNTVVFRQVVDSQVSKLELAAPNFTRNSDLVKALKRGEDAAFAEQVMYAYNRLSSEGVVEKVALYSLEGDLLAGEPELSAIKKTGVLDLVREQNVPASGLDLDVDGRVKTYYAFPVFFRGKTAGYVTLQQSLDVAVAEIGRYLDAEVLVYAEGGDRAIYKTEKLDGTLKDFGVPDGAKQFVSRFKRGGGEYEVGLTELKGYNGDVIAQMATLKDFTAMYKKEGLYSRNALLAMVGAIGIFIAGMFLFLGRSFKPLRKFADDILELANGNVNIKIDSNRRDEIGPIARSMEVFMKNTQENLVKEQRQKEQEEVKLREVRRIEMNNLADKFEQRVSVIVEGVSSAGEDMQKTARQMQMVADNASEQAQNLELMSEQSTSNVTLVASAAEELSASIQDVRKQIENSADIAVNATQKAKVADDAVLSLTESAVKIESVVKLIEDITKQINLLALNATIEASRAGEAGKGFAVVAGEVKNLADQTAKATGEIAAVIEEMSGKTHTTASTIREVSEIVGTINKITAGISSTFVEQEHAVREIAQSAAVASDAVSNVSMSVSNVSEGAQNTGESAKNLTVASSNLSEQAAHLREAVDQFVVEIRA